MKRSIPHFILITGLMMLYSCTPKTVPLYFEERIIAGGQSDFMEVRHLLLRGSNYEIGRKLAGIACTRHNVSPLPYPFMEKTRAQRQYFAEHYPIFFERMRGVAAYFEKDFFDDAWNMSCLPYNFTLPGCSVVYYPPTTTANGHGVLSRNFDFPAGTINGTKPGENEVSACARPYVIEMYPDEGYASLVTCCFDLLGGVCDGINTEGLTVAVLTDNDVIEELGYNPVPGPQAGFNELQIVRHLLDTCPDVESAKSALRRARLYYNMVPLHYIIADRYGRSFIWENDPGMDGGFSIDGDTTPLISTNFLLHRYEDKDNLPHDEFSLGWFNRYRELKNRLSQQVDDYDGEFIKETGTCVSFTQSKPPDPYVPIRTLWHALYYPEQLRLEIDFYLGEEPDTSADTGVRIHRTGYHVFALER